MPASWLRILCLMIVTSWLVVGCNGAKKIDVGGACVLNSDCNQGLVCTWGKCHVACHTSVDCPAGQSCITASDQSTVCQLPVETHCLYASDCPTPLICAVDQRCHNQCRTDVDCPSGQTCTTTKTCAEPRQVDSNNNLIGTDGGVTGSGGASGAGDAGSCPSGAETCSCYPNDTCNAGLTCASHLCVSLGTGGSGGGGAPGTGGSSSPSPDAPADLPVDAPASTGGTSASGGTPPTLAPKPPPTPPSTGGTSASGGTPASGGIAASGGITSAGGVASTDGATGAGGATSLPDAAADLKTGTPDATFTPPDLSPPTPDLAPDAPALEVALPDVSVAADRNETAGVNIETDLVLHYAFDGDVQDQSANSNHGTAVGVATYAAGARGDRAIVFDNPTGNTTATQWVTIPYSSSIRALETTSFSVVVSYKTVDAAGENGRLFGLWPPTIFLDYNAQGVPHAYGGMGDGAKTYFLGYPTARTPVVTTDGAFHCQIIVFDRDAGSLRHYVDGVETDAATQVSLGQLDLNGLVVGAARASDTYAAKATVDDLRLYGRALSPAEVQVLSQQLVP